MKKYTIEEFIFLLTENLNLYNQEHQKAVLKIASSLKAFLEKKNLPYEVFIEIRVNEKDIHSKRIDIAVIDKENSNYVIMIGISTEKTKSAEFEKLEFLKLSFDKIKNSELFIYCYDSLLLDKWYKISYSRIFGELNNLLNP